MRVNSVNSISLTDKGIKVTILEVLADPNSPASEYDNFTSVQVNMEVGIGEDAKAKELLRVEIEKHTSSVNSYKIYLQIDNPYSAIIVEETL